MVKEVILKGSLLPVNGIPANSRHGGCAADRELGTWTFNGSAVPAPVGNLAQWCCVWPAVLEVYPPPFVIHLEVDLPPGGLQSQRWPLLEGHRHFSSFTCSYSKIYSVSLVLGTQSLTT